jgi:putative oligomerization/nucleic acid binding protein
MSLFKGAEERQAARDQRSQAKAEETERKRLDRRAKNLQFLQGEGVLAEGDDGSSLTDTELFKRALEYRRQQSDERMKQIKQRASLRALGIIVKADGSVCDLTWGRRLGPLAGAHAEVTNPSRHHRAGAAVSASVFTMGTGLGPTGALVGLSKKSIAIAVVVFPDGTLHQHRLDGARAVQQAEVAAISFNAMAQEAVGGSLAGAREYLTGAQAGDAAAPGSAVSAADEIKKLAELHAAGILTDDEFAAKKKQLLGL